MRLAPALKSAQNAVSSTFYTVPKETKQAVSVTAQGKRARAVDINTSQIRSTEIVL